LSLAPTTVTRSLVAWLLLGLSACSLVQTDKPRMTFTSSKCSRSSDIGHLEAKVSSRWDNGAFLVNVSKPIICNAKIANPAFELHGQILKVSFQQKISNVVMKCYCDTESTFAFSGLPIAEYHVSFEEQR
jgi:hypothetical protein